MQENYKINIIKFIIILLLLLLPAKGFSAPEYSRETGKSCQVCHVDPAGGRNLTDEGNAFKNELQTKGLHRPLTPAWHIIRFIMGYLHMMTAIIWFGTILYVHILLKPAYASKGLPRGELTLGWLSIIVMTTTGDISHNHEGAIMGCSFSYKIWDASLNKDFSFSDYG